MIPYKFLKYKILLVLCFAQLAYQSGHAGNTRETCYIDSDFKKILLGQNTKILEDSSCLLGIREAEQLLEHSANYWLRDKFTLRYTTANHWLKFDLVNTLNEPRVILVELVNPYLPKSELYLRRGEQEMPFEQVKEHRNVQFKIKLNPLDSINCFLKIQPSKRRSSFDLYIWDYDTRVTRQNTTEVAIIVSFFLLIAAYLFTLGISINITRFNYFWFYFLYVLFGAFFVFTDLGFFYKFSGLDRVEVQEIAIVFITNLYMVFGLFFVRYFFNTPKQKADKLLIALIVLLLVFIPVSIFILSQDFSLGYVHLLFKVHGVLYILSCILLIYLLFSSIYRSEENFSGLFLFGFSLHGLSIVINNLQEISLLPEASISSILMKLDIPLTFHTQLPLFVGMLIEMAIVLYIGIKRFRRIYKERISIAVALAEQKQQAMRNLMKGIERDRKRISADLHDDIGGRLTLISLHLNAIVHKFKTDQSLKKEINVVFNSLAEAHTELRNIAWNLNPGSLMKFGFIATVKEFIEKTKIVNPKMEVNFYCNYNFENVSEFASLSLYRIVHEVINNVNKHSLATELNVQMIDHDGCLLLTFEDDGIGFDPVRVKSKNKGMGMKNLQYRTDSLSGKLDIDAAPGRGTFISIEIPTSAIVKSTN